MIDLSVTELLACARYVEEARDAIEGSDRGRELARKVKAFCREAASPSEAHVESPGRPNPDESAA